MGICSNLFVNEIDDEFTCPICLDILENPVEDPHGHYFCSECINICFGGENATTCPLSRAFMLKSSIKQCRIVENLLSKKKVKCEFKGCKQTVQLGFYAKHKIECIYNEKNFRTCEKDCNLPVRIGHEAEHNCILALKEETQHLLAKCQEASKSLLESREDSAAKELEIRKLKQKLAQSEAENKKQAMVKVGIAAVAKNKPTVKRLATNIRQANTRPIVNSEIGAVTRSRKQQWNPSTLLNE